MKVLRAPETADRLGVSLATLWRWETAGHIPQRIRVGPNVCGWIEEEIDDFIASRPRPNNGPHNREAGLEPEAEPSGAMRPRSRL